MRAEPSRSAQRAAPEPVKPKEPFAGALAGARGAIAARSTGHATTARELQRARAGHAAEAKRLGEVRAEPPPPGGSAAVTRPAGVKDPENSGLGTSVKNRGSVIPRTSAAGNDPSLKDPGSSAARERLARALEEERDRPPVALPPAALAPLPAVEPGTAPGPAPRVQSALQLVERIEVFLRYGRPQLELSVGGQLRAEVLLERTGPLEVAVTIRGRNGPPPPHELARIREGIRHRGLRLSSLAVS